MRQRNKRINRYDAVLVVLGGLDPKGSPYAWVFRRLKKALNLYTGREFIILLGRGTVHKPPILDRQKFVIPECLASARILKKLGVDSKHLLLENFSLDTIGNGIFSRIIFADPLKLKKLAVITSDHHMPRVRAIFEWVYSLTPKKNHYNLDFISVSDSGIDPKIITARIQKEKKSLKNILLLREKIKTLKDFHRWLFTRHAVYAYGLKIKKVSLKTLKTY